MKDEERARLYHIPIPPQLDLPISYNIAPSQNVLAIRSQRSLDALRWGLIPYWAKDPKIGYRTINARMESVDTAPSFREAFKKRRCLIPTDGFYEWKKVPGGKIPFSIGMMGLPLEPTATFHVSSSPVRVKFFLIAQENNKQGQAG